MEEVDETVHDNLKMDDKTPLTKVISDVSEGINEAAPVFTPVEDPVVKENNGKQAVRYLLWGLVSVVVNFGTFFYSIGRYI